MSMYGSGRLMVCLMLVIGTGMPVLLQAEEDNEAASEEASQDASSDGNKGSISINSRYSYDMLDPTTNINRKQLLLLENKRRGEIADNSVTLGAAVTGIVDYHSSNTAGKFGYLMRHPTSGNQVGTDASEAVIHSAQLSISGTAGSWVTAHMELLYDPEQSFGAGTITALARNQVQLRRGYILLGDLEKSPVYVSLGKMATPFGWTDTVNPFTNSTVWHAFGGLAYGAQVGYVAHGLNASFMAVQGGAQFRATHTPVEGTVVPSLLNNFVVDLNYTVDLESDASDLLFGGSYERGSAYCQDFPVQHFTGCADNNPAFDVYTVLTAGNLTVLAEYAKTIKEWPGTFNPAILQFAAHRVSSFDVGGRYRVVLGATPVDLSADFSRFVAGPDGAPWDNQDQLVLGLAAYVVPTAKLFGEYIRVNGYAPLNFISGGGGPNVGPGQTHSDNAASSNVFIVGMNVAF